MSYGTLYTPKPPSVTEQRGLFLLLVINCGLELSFSCNNKYSFKNCDGHIMKYLMFCLAKEHHDAYKCFMNIHNPLAI